jgi:heme exporter protein A
VKILAGVISPNDGNFTITLDGTEVKRDDIYRHVGLVAPYLQLYEEFSAWENLDLFRKLRGVDVPDVSLDGLLEKVGLYKRKHDLVRTYSSGMKQRLKYAFALLHEPEVLLLDEPTSNLDAEGMSMVSEVIAVHRTKGIVIVATNVREEVQRCDASLDLDADPARQGVRS